MIAHSVPTPPPAVAAAPVSSTGPASGPALLAEPAITPKRESDCGYLALVPVKTAKGGAKAKPVLMETKYRSLAGFRVLAGPFQLAAPRTESPVWAYRCTRDTVVPAALDGRVILFLQKPLILTDGARSGVLEIDKGAFVYNLSRGQLSESEKQAIQQRLNIFTANYRAAVAAAQKAGAAKGGAGKAAPGKSAAPSVITAKSAQPARPR